MCVLHVYRTDVLRNSVAPCSCILKYDVIVPSGGKLQQPVFLIRTLTELGTWNDDDRGGGRGGTRQVWDRQINRSTFNYLQWIHSRNAEAISIAPLFVRKLHLVILEQIYTHIHIASRWHEEIGSKRDCCCTRVGPRCEVARRPGEVRDLL